MKSKALSRYLVFLIGAIMAMDFMIVLTSIAGFWAYIGGDLKWYGIVFSVYDFTQFFTGPLLGLWVDKRNYKEVFIITIIVNAIGNFLYSYSYDAKSIPMFIIGRCIAGLGSGNLSVGFGYLALSSTNEERSTVFGLYRLWSTIGRMSGPFLGAFLFFVGSTKIGHLTLNAYTLPSYIMIIADIILIPLVFTLKEPRNQQELDEVKTDKISKVEAFKALGKDGFICNVLYFLAILAFWSWFPLVLVFAVVEYGFAPTGGEYAFAYSAVGWGFGGSVLFLRSFHDKLKDYYWLSSGPILMIAGFIVFMFKGGTAVYLIGTTVLCFGFNLVATVSSTYFSKLIQEKGLTAYMATFMGGQFAISSFGRFLGPTWAPTALKFGATGWGCCDYTASPPILDCCTIDGQYQVFGILLGFTFFLLLGSIFLLRRDLDDKLKVNENTERDRLLGNTNEPPTRYE